MSVGAQKHTRSKKVLKINLSKAYIINTIKLKKQFAEYQQM
jgi:hypothetical protein